MLGGLMKVFLLIWKKLTYAGDLKNLGKNIFYTSDSKVFHVGGGTLNYNSSKKTYLNYRNNLWMIHKNYKGKVPLFIFILIRIKLDLISGIKLLIFGNFKNFIAILKAHINYIKSINQIQNKRNKIDTLKFSSHTGYCKKSIIWNYFFSKKKVF